MKLPKQSAPVQRNINGAPISGENGSVEASGMWEIIKQVGGGLFNALTGGQCFQETHLNPPCSQNITEGEKIMKLPKQSAPVERTITGTPISSNNGVEAQWLKTAVDLVTKVGPGIWEVFRPKD